MAWQLYYRGTDSVPVEVEGIIPEKVDGLSRMDLLSLPVMVGNRAATVGDFFDVDPPSSDEPMDRIDFHGDLSGVHWLGAGMTRGCIHVHGPAGRHVGSGMRGGRIEVHGTAGDWVGGELHGGLIHVHGDAGHLVGAAYRGSQRGMTGGTILVDGSVGNELGHTMRRGLIAVGGDAGDLIGFNMLAGTVIVMGTVGIRHGAGMRRGTLAFFGPERPTILPTFRFACRCRPLAMSLLFQRLRSLDFQFDASLAERTLELYNGDFIAGGDGVGGRGELFLTT